MELFSKSKPNNDLQLFLSEFPVWAAILSVKLVDELQTEDTTSRWPTILENSLSRQKLIDCLIGANLFYIRLTPEGALASLLFGENFLEKVLPSLPDETKVYFAMAYQFYEKENQNGNVFTSLLENWYKIKIDPLDACAAFVIEQEISGSEEFTLLVGALLPTLNRLRVKQLEWLKEITEKWSNLK